MDILDQGQQSIDPISTIPNRCGATRNHKPIKFTNIRREIAILDRKDNCFPFWAHELDKIGELLTIFGVTLRKSAFVRIRHQNGNFHRLPSLCGMLTVVWGQTTTQQECV